MELMAAVGRELAQHAGGPSFPTGHASPLTAQITSLPPKAEPSCGAVTAVSAHAPAAVVPQHSREQQGPRWVLGPPVPPPHWADAEEEIEHPYSLFRHELDGLRKILALGAARLQLGTRCVPGTALCPRCHCHACMSSMEGVKRQSGPSDFLLMDSGVLGEHLGAARRLLFAHACYLQISWDVTASCAIKRAHSA